jgi:AcrR family transcriptional regulator
MSKLFKSPAPTKGAKTRERIIEQALLLFSNDGVDATSLKDIAVKVGISEPAIYRHFVSKADLVWEIFSTGYCGVADALDKAQQTETTLRGKLDRIIEVYCKLHDTNEALFRFLFVTQHGQVGRITPDMPTPIHVVVRVITEGIANKEIPKRDPQLLAAMVFGLATQPAVFHMYGRITGKMSRYRRTLSDAAWAAISFQEGSKS